VLVPLERVRTIAHRRSLHALLAARAIHIEGLSGQSQVQPWSCCAQRQLHLREIQRVAAVELDVLHLFLRDELADRPASVWTALVSACTVTLEVTSPV